MNSMSALPSKQAQRIAVEPVRRGATRAPASNSAKPKRNWPQINWLVVRRVLYVFAAVIALGGLMEGWRYAQPYINQPIARIVVKGNLTEFNQRVLEQRVEPFVNAKFFAVDIAGIQDALGQVAWISKANISRVWPDQLVIDVVEQKPVAHWGEDNLLNVKAHVFSKQGMQGYQKLPYLAGPENSQDAVMEQYGFLSNALRPLGYSIDKLEMRERGSWFITTQDGLELLLGREQVMEKMRRFVTIYEKELKDQINQIARIDLRYANGLAVTWRTAANDAVVQ